MTWEETSNLLRQIYPNCYESRDLRKKWLTDYRRRQNPRSSRTNGCYLLLPCEGLKKDGLYSSFAPPAFFSILATFLPMTSTT